MYYLGWTIQISTIGGWVNAIAGKTLGQSAGDYCLTGAYFDGFVHRLLRAIVTPSHAALI